MKAAGELPVAITPRRLKRSALSLPVPLMMWPWRMQVQHKAATTGANQLPAQPVHHWNTISWYAGVCESSLHPAAFQKGYAAMGAAACFCTQHLRSRLIHGQDLTVQLTLTRASLHCLLDTRCPLQIACPLLCLLPDLQARASRRPGWTQAAATKLQKPWCQCSMAKEKGCSAKLSNLFEIVRAVCNHLTTCLGSIMMWRYLGLSGKLLPSRADLVDTLLVCLTKSLVDLQHLPILMQPFCLR